MFPFYDSERWKKKCVDFAKYVGSELKFTAEFRKLTLSFFETVEQFSRNFV